MSSVYVEQYSVENLATQHIIMNRIAQLPEQVNKGVGQSPKCNSW
jgi:hypothetical protein